MDQPLGRAVGNSIEVVESVEVLRGGGPSDVRELTLTLARLMLELVDINVDPREKLDDGSAYEVYRSMIAAQGGDPDAVLVAAPVREVVTSQASGWVSSLDARCVGVAAWRLGAGRARKEDPVSAGAGVMCLVREGEQVALGQPIFELYADDDQHLARGRETIQRAMTIGGDQPTLVPILLETITR
jgi:thymidine phosphorylase